MSDTNITTHPDFKHIGPCSMALYDEINDLLVVTGMTDQIRLAKNVTDIVASKVIVNGREVEERAQPVGEEYILRGRLTETLNPNTQYLVMKNCGTPLVTGDCTIGTIKERVQMYQDVQHILKYNNGFYGSGALPAPQSVVGTAFGTGGTIASGTYVFTAIPLYDGTRGADVSSVGEALVLGEQMSIVVTHPAGTVPDDYEIYVHDTALAETIADADLIATILSGGSPTEASIVFSSWTRGAAYPGAATGSFTVTDTTGVIEYIVNVDFTIDDTCGMFCLIDGGSIGDGQWIDIEYTYWKNPQVDMTIGPSNRLPRYVHPVLIAFHDDDRDTPVGKGVEIHLYKVVADSSWEWDLSSLNYDSAFEFEWKIMMDRRYMHHGHIYNFHRQFAEYGLLELADMTQWNNAANCVVAAS